MKLLMLSVILMTTLLSGCGKEEYIFLVEGSKGDNNKPTDIYNRIYDGNVSILCGQDIFNSDVFNSGKILGQDGWDNNDHSPSIFDEKIINVGSNACRGNGVWFVNNSLNNTSNSFGNMPSSPAMTESAGESSVRSANGGDTMETTFFFKTVSNIGDGSAIEIDFANPESSDRNNFIKFVNDDNPRGLYVYSSNNGVAAPSYYRIPRGTWNHIRMIAIHRDGLNPDGTGNDIVRIYLNGVLIIENTTYEQYRTSGSFCTVACPNYVYAVSRMMFRITTPSNTVKTTFISPQGFMFDDLTTKIYDRINPAEIKSIYRTGFEL